MVIEKEKLIALIETYLPQSDNATVERIAIAVKVDAEAIVHSMIRQAVAQEKQHLYIQKKTG